MHLGPTVVLGVYSIYVMQKSLFVVLLLEGSVNSTGHYVIELQKLKCEGILIKEICFPTTNKIRKIVAVSMKITQGPACA